MPSLKSLDETLPEGWNCCKIPIYTRLCFPTNWLWFPIMTRSTKAGKPQRMYFETLFHHNFILVPRAYDLLVSGWINFKICWALGTNLVPRVLRHFGQWLVARRDSGELEFYYRPAVGCTLGRLFQLFHLIDLQNLWCFIYSIDLCGQHRQEHYHYTFFKATYRSSLRPVLSKDS